jgi:glycerophosphoryl diester phosphodiesterase
MAAAVAKVIKEEGIAKRTQLQSFDWRCLAAIQKINPDIATAYLTDVPHERLMRDDNPEIAGMWTAGKLLKNYHGSIPQMVKALGGKYWDPQDIEISADQVREAHNLGLKVIAWTNPVTSGKDVDLDMMKKLVAMGVDGIITDRPDLVSKIKN